MQLRKSPAEVKRRKKSRWANVLNKKWHGFFQMPLLHKRQQLVTGARLAEEHVCPTIWLIGL